MPTFARKTLRQNLGREHLRDTYVGTTRYSPSVAADASVVVMDRRLVNNDLADDGLYKRAYLRVAGDDYRVATFNAGSGALVTANLAVTTVGSGAEFELGTLLGADEKDKALDDVIKRLRVRQEVPVAVVDGAAFYPLAAVGIARPEDVFDAYYFADPSGSLDRGQRRFAWFDPVQTATGLELRIDPALGGSAQIVLDAIVSLTLGAGDAATLSVPDERLVLAGAAAKCYDLVIARSPGQESSLFEERRREKANEFSDLIKSFRPEVARKIEFDRPFSKQTSSWWWE